MASGERGFIFGSSKPIGEPADGVETRGAGPKEAGYDRGTVQDGAESLSRPVLLPQGGPSYSGICRANKGPSRISLGRVKSSKKSSGAGREERTRRALARTRDSAAEKSASPKARVARATGMASRIGQDRPR